MNIEHGGGFSPDRLTEDSITEFTEAWSRPGTEKLMPKVIAKLKKDRNPDQILEEIRTLDKDLTDVFDDEEIVKKLERYAQPAVGEDDVDDSEAKDGWGSDEE